MASGQAACSDCLQARTIGLFILPCGKGHSGQAGLGRRPERVGGLERKPNQGILPHSPPRTCFTLPLEIPNSRGKTERAEDTHWLPKGGLKSQERGPLPSLPEMDPHNARGKGAPGEELLVSWWLSAKAGLDWLVSLPGWTPGEFSYHSHGVVGLSWGRTLGSQSQGLLGTNLPGLL